MSSVLKYKKRFKRFGHKGAITSLAFDTSGSILAAGSLDGHISVWAAATGSSLHRVNARTPILSLVWLSGSEGFVFGCENGILASVLLEEVRPPFPILSQVVLILLSFHRYTSRPCIFMLTPDRYVAYHPAPMTSCGFLEQLTKSPFGNGTEIVLRGKVGNFSYPRLSEANSAADRNMGSTENDATTTRATSPG
jgi:hypothetical protein